MINLFVFNYRISHCLGRSRVHRSVVLAFHAACCRVHVPRAPSIKQKLLQNHLAGESVLNHWTVLTIQTREEICVSLPHVVFMQIVLPQRYDWSIRTAVEFIITNQRNTTRMWVATGWMAHALFSEGPGLFLLAKRFGSHRKPKLVFFSLIWSS